MNPLDYQHIFHEIKNSVTLINSSLQLLERQIPTLREEHHWLNTVNEVCYLKNMILEFSQTGNPEQLNLEKTNINQTIHQIVCFLQDSYPNIKWELKLDSSIKEIRADSIKFRQAILNLIKNSIEAMNETGKITLCSYNSKQEVGIQITDFGGGINPELEPKIFDLFFTSKKNGTGLGLAITRHIIQLHNGTLKLINRPGIGCTFSILLPKQ